MRTSHSNISKETREKMSKARKGTKVKDEFLKGYSERASGAKNPGAKIIHIYDSNDVLQYETHGNFLDICKLHNLPASGFARSYRENGKKLLKRPYRGWYAKIAS